MEQTKKEVIADVTRIMKTLPEDKQQRALGFMEGMKLVIDEVNKEKEQCVTS